MIIIFILNNDPAVFSLLFSQSITSY